MNEVAQNITGVTQAADESQKSADQVLSAAQDVAGHPDDLAFQPDHEIAKELDVAFDDDLLGF